MQSEHPVSRENLFHRNTLNNRALEVKATLWMTFNWKQTAQLNWAQKALWRIRCCQLTTGTVTSFLTAKFQRNLMRSHLPCIQSALHPLPLQHNFPFFVANQKRKWKRAKGQLWNNRLKDCMELERFWMQGSQTVAFNHVNQCSQPGLGRRSRGPHTHSESTPKWPSLPERFHVF